MEHSPGDPALVDFLRRQISAHGPVTFKWFMQQALYHPQFGYYGAGKARIGRRGDFYTSVSVGRIFGELMAKQFEEMWLRMNKPLSFTIVEEGAHSGQFAHDVLHWMKTYSPEFFHAAKYWIAEPNSRLQQEQQAMLSTWPRNKVRWCQSLFDLEAGSLCGVHFSNELLDAFPVHLVTSTDGGPWEENFVDTKKEGFHLVYGPPSNSQLRAHLEKLPRHPAPPGATGPQTYTTEVNLAAARWIEDVGKVMTSGYVLLADYGYPRDVYYFPERTTGTLMTYRDQQKSGQPLESIGERDITAHVDFTTLAERAEAVGLKLTGFCDQHHFLIGLGKDELLKIERSIKEMTPELLHFVRSFKTLMHPSTMGMAFKFICFQKNVPASEKPLSGFSECKDGRLELGLAPLAEQSSKGPRDPYASY